MQKPRITILIAVYNSEKYLRQCLDSLKRQTLREWQAVCVDDCSTDGSLSILNDYASSDERFEVIHLDANHGLAHARNVGLERANADIVCFLDSDDWLSDDALESVVGVFDNHPNTDSVLFHCVIFNDGKVSDYDMADFDVMTGREAFEKSLTWAIHGVYAVRTPIHKKYQYDETLRSYGDENVTRLHYLASREVRTCSGIYYYRQHESSVSHKIDGSQFNSLKANYLMKESLMTMNVGRDIIATYENVRWLNIIDLCLYYYLHHKDLSDGDAHEGILTIRKARKSIDIDMLDSRSSKHKFGYMPMMFSWKIFRIQEWIYFFIRGLFGKNNGRWSV